MALRGLIRKGEEAQTFAVQNEHPGIKGMPILEEQEARRIAKAILALKGITKQQQIDALQKDELQLIPKPLG